MTAVREALHRCRTDGVRLRALIAVLPSAADEVPAPGPLHGVPVVVKDNVAVAGEPMTAGGRILDAVSGTDAAAVARLRAAGAVVVARANMHEFAWGGTGANPHHGDVANPRRPDRIAGGSSAGSAAAVAAGCVPMAIGTDTGGSVRFPAALTGTVGLRPTPGAVPVGGTFPLAPTLDTVGPITATVEQNARMFAVLSGRDPVPVADDVTGLRLVSLRERWVAGAQPGVAAAVTAARDGLVAAGARWSVADGTDPDDATAAIGPILLVEASAGHREWITDRPRDYGPDVRALLERGLTVPGVDYVDALRTGRAVRERMLRVLDSADAVIGPMLPFTAPPHGATTVVLGGGRPADLAGTMLDHSAVAAVAGLPALSVPCGIDADGLPVGLHLIGPPDGEAVLYRIAARIEALCTAGVTGGRREAP